MKTIQKTLKFWTAGGDMVEVETFDWEDSCHEVSIQLEETSYPNATKKDCGEPEITKKHITLFCDHDSALTNTSDIDNLIEALKQVKEDILTDINSKPKKKVIRKKKATKKKTTKKNAK
jgi:hypothetical protein